MSDRKALAREIPARTKPRFIEIKKEKRDRRPIVLGPEEMRALPYRTRKGSLHHQLHSRLDGWNAAAPGPQKLLPQQIRLT